MEEMLADLTRAVADVEASARAGLRATGGPGAGPGSDGFTASPETADERGTPAGAEDTTSSDAEPVTWALARLDGDELVELLARLEQARRTLDALTVAATGEAVLRSHRGLPRVENLARSRGHRTAVDLIAHSCRISGAEAKRRVALAEALTPQYDAPEDGPLPEDVTLRPAIHPHVADAVLAGRIGTDSARAIMDPLDEVAATGGVDPEVLGAAESALTEFAVIRPTNAVAERARTVRDDLGRHAGPARQEDLHAYRSLTLSRSYRGMRTLKARLDPLSAAVVATWLDAETNPRSPENAAAMDTVDGPTREQARADALVRTLAARLNSADTSETGGIRPQVVVTMTVQDLLDGGLARLEGGEERITGGQARRLACDGGVLPAVLGGDSQVLDLGRTHRLFSPAQRRALALRDGGCISPDCEAPPAWCEAHHIVPWQAGGPTDLSNAVLLCGFHHDEVHRHDPDGPDGWRITMIDDVPHVTAPTHRDPDRVPRPAGRTGRDRAWRAKHRVTPGNGKPRTSSLGKDRAPEQQEGRRMRRAGRGENDSREVLPREGVPHEAVPHEAVPHGARTSDTGSTSTPGAAGTGCSEPGGEETASSGPASNEPRANELKANKTRSNETGSNETRARRTSSSETGSRQTGARQTGPLDPDSEGVDGDRAPP